MTTGTGRIQSIFDDARDLQADALEILAQGRIRNPDGPGTAARIRRNLSPGHYTITGTTYRDDATGTYTLEVSGHDQERGEGAVNRPFPS